MCAAERTVSAAVLGGREAGCAYPRIHDCRTAAASRCVYPHAQLLRDPRRLGRLRRLLSPAELAATLELFQYQDGALAVAAVTGGRGFRQSHRSGVRFPRRRLPAVIQLCTHAGRGRSRGSGNKKSSRRGPTTVWPWRGADGVPRAGCLARLSAISTGSFGSRLPESPILAACEHQLLLHSIELAHALPGPVELSSASLRQNGMNEEEISSIVRVYQQLESRLCHAAAANLAAKISAEGGNVYRNPRKKPGRTRQRSRKARSRAAHGNHASPTVFKF